MNYPRVLVISNNCFSTIGSNGRTLSNLFYKWPASRLAQFYIKEEVPDFKVCKNYFCITDHQILRSYLKRMKIGCTILEEYETVSPACVSKGRTKKTVIKAIVRNVLWRNMWKNQKLRRWINDFNPQVVLFQVGDSPFMYDLAMKITENRKIPLVVYNCENYYFKTKNFMNPDFFNNRIYPFYYRYLKRQFELLMKRTCLVIYNTEALKAAYSKLNIPGIVFMTPTTMSANADDRKQEKIIYAGNLGVGRVDSLIRLGKALKKITQSGMIDVYGRASEEDAKRITAAEGLNYKGVIAYNQVEKVMRESRFVLHVESFVDFYKEDLKYAFSTKLADCLACYSCLIVYAPEELNFISYLRRLKCAHIISSETQLEVQLREIFDNPDLQDKYIKNAKDVVKQFHNPEVNAEKFLKAINQIGELTY